MAFAPAAMSYRFGAVPEFSHAANRASAKRFVQEMNASRWHGHANEQTNLRKHSDHKTRW
jgi:hypothetical protein